MPYSTAFNTLPPTVDPSILKMSQENIKGSGTQGSGGSAVKQEAMNQGGVPGTGSVALNQQASTTTTGLTKIKNYQGHNLHWQHFMKQEETTKKNPTLSSRPLKTGTKRKYTRTKGIKRE